MFSDNLMKSDGYLDFALQATIIINYEGLITDFEEDNSNDCHKKLILHKKLTNIIK